MSLVVTVALGPIALLVGLLGASAGLVVIGAWWTALAVVALPHSRRVRAARAAKAPSLRLVLRGAALYLSAGVPALVVGLTRWGIDEPDLRWLPLVVGAILIGQASLGLLLYSLGFGLEKVAGELPTVPATITIVTAKETGTFVNERPRIEFVLDVTPDGRPAYRVTKKATVPFTALGSIRPGDGFRALVEGPDDLTNMQIDWEASLPRA